MKKLFLLLTITITLLCGGCYESLFPPEKTAERIEPVSDIADEINYTEKGAKILVLNYHKVDHQEISLSVTPEDFDRQLRYIRDSGYHAISMDDMYNAIAGTGELPPNPVLITFDDGYKDNYTNAYPILKRHGFKATIFVISDFVGRENYMNWDELRAMAKDGFNIESHTATHESLTDISDERLEHELAHSKKKIEEEIGREVNFLAYPTGAYNLHIAQKVKDAGYKAAFTVKYGNTDVNSNIFALERVPVFHTENTMKSFVERLHYTPLLVSQGWQLR